MQLGSFNLMQWIKDNRAQLTPPMVNKPIWRDREFVVMILAGPITRADYHDDPFEEFFFQLKGNMVLKTIQNGKHEDIPVNEGGVFLMPAHLPRTIVLFVRSFISFFVCCVCACVCAT